MKKHHLDRKILILEIGSISYLLFLYEYVYNYIPSILNTIIGVFMNLLTIPILLIAIPFGIAYALYQLAYKKNKSIIYTLILSTISIVGMITMTILDK